LLDANESACVDAVEVAEGELRVTTSCPGTLGLQPGVIVVGPHPSGIGGFLRQVTAVNPAESTVTLETEKASVSDALDEPASLSQTMAFGRRSAVDFSGTELYDDGDLSVRIKKGVVTLDPTLQLDLDYGIGGLDYAEAILELDGSLDLKVRVHAEGAFHRAGSITPFTYQYPITTTIGPVPVYGVLELSYDVGYDVYAEAGATATAGFFVESKVDLGVIWDGDEFQPLWEEDTDFTWKDPTLDVEASVVGRVYITPRAALVMYETVGGSFEVETFAQVEAEADLPELPWSVDVGLEARAGLSLEFFTIDIASKTFDLASWSTTIVADTDGDGTMDHDDCAPYDPTYTDDCSACLSGEIEDCNGDCIDASYLGDAYCDSELDCLAYSFDDGDCSGCPSGEIDDCNGNCVNAAWLGDGICDANLDCQALNYDDGDCSGCTYHTDCASDEFCLGSACEQVLGRQYRVTILSVSSEPLVDPNGNYWDADFSDADMLVGFGTSSNYVYTATYSNSTYAAVQQYDDFTLDGSTFTLDFYDDDWTGNDLYVTWAWTTTSDFVSLARSDGQTLVATDSSGTISIELTAEAL
ncbi:MAG: hypothetical protein HN348_29485, partial [Proteobacteria bacterium]|nr:hypothetical protein [Pseudomonadota bacterium]